MAPCFSALGFRLARRTLDIPSVEQQALETPCADGDGGRCTNGRKAEADGAEKAGTWGQRLFRAPQEIAAQRLVPVDPM